MPATLIDTMRPDLAVSDVPASQGQHALPRPVPIRRMPSRRRRRVTGRLSRLAAMLAMGAWIVLGLMPVAAVLLSVYG